MTKILIVDDHPMVTEGLKSLLSTEVNLEVVAICNNAYDTMEFLKNNTVNIAFLDINLPDINGIELCKKIKTSYPTIKSIAITTFAERSYITKMIEAGALGYLLKNSTKDIILEAIHKVGKGEYFMNVPYHENNETENSEAPYLTKREKEVLSYIAEGMTNQEIATKLFLSVLTVNSHRKNLMYKFNANNTALMIKEASKFNLF